ncbi:unnamed protein product [Angiostrongylus costaricensis]|uniref:SH2 domain-containing protein n=1 Tax=Angiostrongylus costaricensis TaxID=334426 RepID=A0A0R3PXS4_ANGCS|nr:unnamed protein product [Angiostrongylus costaricensis]
MSVLSEILSTGHVDKELLDALDDAQKQLLFCQMRAEQVRKWQANEERLEREGAPKKSSKKGIKWLTGADGEVWVWVMGDHPLDKSIEEILEEEVTTPVLWNVDVQRRESEIFQNKRARDAEEAMRKMAQKAREQHRQLIRTSTSILPALSDTKATSLREAIKNLPRPPKPKSRAAIVDWFKRDEWPRGTGQDPKTRMPAPWFHGIISRDQAEILLQDKPTGSFLVRVSERIWGYTVSYVVGDGTYKHFLVERIPEGYQFLGTNQVVHDQLFDLVSYHETAPITAKGGEVLKWSVGQIFRPPDYHDIVPEFAVNRLVGRF